MDNNTPIRIRPTSLSRNAGRKRRMDAAIEIRAPLVGGNVVNDWNWMEDN
jgi:hypothetical protein